MLNVDLSKAQQQLRVEMLRRSSATGLPMPTTVECKAWPPNYDRVLLWRRQQLDWFEFHADEPEDVASALRYYRDRPVEFINHWCDLYEPRNVSRGVPVRFPFVMFPRQEELVRFLQACLHGSAPGLVEKSRDMGATWLCAAFSVWLWLFWPGAAIGWGSMKQEQVDRLGDPSSIFEKLRLLIRRLPAVFLPKGFDESKHLLYTRCVNPENGAVITGEVGDNIGRGGRCLIYFVDEAAHLSHPEMMEAALSENTRVRIDISSVSGLGTVFHRTREAGAEWSVGQPVVRDRANVFIMDWKDHPAKDREWYKERKAYFDNKGLPHVFAREIERNYAASVVGSIIQKEWIDSAIDAHIALGITEEGPWIAGLDVADGGGDRNALAKRHGVVIKLVQEWTERDTGLTARRAVTACNHPEGCEIQYDCIGVGAGIKAETNRLKDEGLIPAKLKIVAWNAAAAVQDPSGRVIPGDKDSPVNRAFYANLKAQAWWMLRRRFELTHRARTEVGFTYDPGELISLDSKSIGPILRKVEKELAQATVSPSALMKLVVDKAPEGTVSPNLADAIVMCCWPVRVLTGTVSIFGPQVL